ncbi:MAG: tyrosine-type recombinase/integrase [Clostridia bacterium]|nr:tyrosine-type recombinase/integrase [Clostridia bacterium]
MDSYFLNRTKKTNEKLSAVLKELPDFCKTLFIGIQNSTGPLTRLNYAYDLRLFFLYLAKELNKNVVEITLSDLQKLNVHDLEGFINYISLYENEENKLIENRETGRARKIASIRMMFKYFYKSGDLESNVASLIDLPKLHEKAIIRLDVDEVAKLLDGVEAGVGLTEKQKHFHALTKSRDLALLTLFLGTGIRISECIGLNCEDIDFRNMSIRITRKGGNQSVLYLSDEVAEALNAYSEERAQLKGADSPAFFLSLQGSRISTRAVQNLVKKYASIITPLKHITPHKLRSTYGTNLYQETGDIYLVADVLGHKDVNTTRRHYAAQAEENRRLAAKSIKLRDKGDENT